MRLALAVVLVTATPAYADAPSGYQCQPGSPKVGEGCTCPTGFATKRDVENTAVCKVVQKANEAATIKRECSKLDASRVFATVYSGATLSGDELKKFRAAFGKSVAARCESAPWRKDVRACFAKATTDEAAYECYELLPPMQRTGLEADAARAYPVGVTVKDTRLVLSGRLVFSQATLSTVSTPLIEAIAKTLSANPKMRLQIEAHTDNVDPSDQNLRLSQARADAVRMALARAGIPAGRVTARGHGDGLPIASNASAWSRAQNRRIELQLVAPDPKAKPDKDQDGIADADDICPDDVENLNGIEDTDGCPDKIKVTSTRIEILDRVMFKSASTVIDAAHQTKLDTLARVLKGNPDLRVRVVGHTDDLEPDPVKLGAARARAVRDYLIKGGADAQRLEVFTEGEGKPAALNSTDAGRATNRRVEFEVL
jgi:outer membrane protein OmpA-like peptidoglycan-associated protein